MADQITEDLLEGISLYFHVPFCQKKCHYCDFLSFPVDPKIYDFYPYFDALYRECEARLAKLQNGSKMLHSLYVGGGTPSLVPVEYYSKLWTLLHRYFSSEACVSAENTFEANPESVTIESLKALRSMGFNRISLGIQSLNPQVLERMGRVHTVKTAFQAAGFAKTVFENVNCDFIVGYEANPYDILNPLLRFIRTFQPEHLSVYPLEIHPDTVLGKEGGDWPNVTAKGSYPGSVFLPLQDLLRSEGYRHYEVSSYARPGCFSIHNLRYWNNADYLGMGLSAGGHIKTTRYVNTSEWEKYVCANDDCAIPEPSYYSENDTIDEIRETLFMGFRTAEGIDLNRLARSHPMLDIRSFLNQFCHEEPFVIQNNRLRLEGESFFYNYEALEKAMDICDRYFTE
ncbi:MAG TPA: radical SAM family heme chaperone HemW [Thermotogota bacterium]|nr:radical SAM family heme chaperone HemW [Thermotogota bacterium]